MFNYKLKKILEKLQNLNNFQKKLIVFGIIIILGIVLVIGSINNFQENLKKITLKKIIKSLDLFEK